MENSIKCLDCKVEAIKVDGKYQCPRCNKVIITGGTIIQNKGNITFSI